MATGITKLGPFFADGRDELKRYGEVSTGQLRVMGYPECGAGRGFERLEEKRTSR
jgi:hypothetical protein